MDRARNPDVALSLAAMKQSVRLLVFCIHFFDKLVVARQPATYFHHHPNRIPQCIGEHRQRRMRAGIGTERLQNAAGG